jgi:hypothetical protein
MHSLPEGGEVANLIQDLMNEVPRKTAGSDRSNESTPPVDRLYGHFGSKMPVPAPISPSVDTTPGPFDTFTQSWHVECAAQEELFQSEHGNTEAGGKITAYTSTREELEELYAWSKSFSESHSEQEDVSRNSKNSDHSRSPSYEPDDLLYVFRNFIASESPELEDGITLLIHDIPRQFKCQPHIFDMIDSLTSIDSVDYVYLPVSVDRPHSNHFWNKGYCFIHFSDANIGQKFMNKISDYKVPEGMSKNDGEDKDEPHGKLRAVFAKFQGRSTNLHNLIDVDSKKWRPKNNSVYVRTTSGLSNISLLDLRVLAKNHFDGLKCKGNRHNALNHSKFQFNIGTVN